MKNIIVLGLVSLCCAACAPSMTPSDQTVQNPPIATNPTTMQITSSAFAAGAMIPVKYSCKGESVNPPLTISNVPTGATSLALVVDDPDAPSGTWTHWTVWNIAPTTATVVENSIPQDAVQGTNSAKNNFYQGPCPPSGTHRYFFKLYALDTMLELPASADVAALNASMAGHILASAELMGTFASQ